MRNKFISAIERVKGHNWMLVTMNMLALMVVVQNVNATCLWLDHQPEVPDEAKRFKKI